jgi:predicted membrane-bound spermidine synthase
MRTSRLVLYAVVAIGGGAVLAIEILGTRLLGPFYGVSLFLWSALITVTLAALSLGYVVGGRWADRGPTFSRIALVFLAAGSWLLVTPWVRRSILDLTEPMGLRAAVLVSSFLLFFPPLALLGIVGPYAIRLKTRSVEEVGRTAGDVYAVSTVASVVAALLTGFVLIPNVGVMRLVMGTGGMLLVGAGLAFLADRRGGLAMLLLVAALGGGGLAAWRLPGESPRPDLGLLAVRQSPYAELRVLDWEDSRILLIDGGGHSVIDRNRGRSLYPYVVTLDIARFFFPGPGKLLLVGLGGGSVARSYDETGWDVTAVEIDPMVVELAREYFDLGDAARVTVQDGRRFLAEEDDRYDIIVLDAFGSSSIPFHLVTEEAFALVRERLTSDGVLGINVESRGWHGPFVQALGATLKTSFSEVLALPLAEPRDAFGNLVLLASNRKLAFSEDELGRPRDFLDDSYWHWAVVTRNHAWDNRFDPGPEGGRILTDDLSPVDIWAEEINLQARRELHRDYDWKQLSY